MIPRYGHRVEAPGIEPRVLGPEKDHSPSACHLGMVAPTIAKAALADLERAGNVNHLGDAERYPMSKGVTLEGYRQVLLQNPISDGSFQRDYTADTAGMQTVGLLRSTYPSLGLYRARLLVLSPGHTVPWHVDEAPREFARIHFMIQGSANWLIRRRGNTLAATMQAGEVWWANVGWPHSITNATDEDRIVLMVHADWDRMIETFGALVEHASPAA